jgi:4-amino-4-deoxy-L-arabinose transferase-like glycosyltransferase
MSLKESAIMGFRRFGRFMQRPRTSWILFAIAIVLRLVPLILLADAPLSNDMRSYHEVALHVVAGDQYTPAWPPGLPYYLAFFHLIFGSSELSSRIAAFVAGIAMLALFHHLAARLISLRAANILLLGFAVLPSLVFHSLEPLTQAPTAVCLLAAIALVTRERRPTPTTGLAIGAVLGALVLIRPSSLLVAGCVLAYQFARWRNSSAVMWPVVSMALLLGAWTVKAHALTGRWVAINYYNSANFFYGNNPFTPLYRTWWLGSHGAGEEGVPPEYTRLIASLDSLPPHERDARFRAEALAHISARPDLFLVRSVSRMRSFFAFDTFPGSYLIAERRVSRRAGLVAIGVDAAGYLALLGIALFAIAAAAGGRMRRAVRWLLLWVVVSYAVPYWLSFAHPSYHTPVLPVLALLAAPAIEQLLAHGFRSAWKRLTPRRRIAFFAALALAAAIQAEWILAMGGRA